MIKTDGRPTIAWLRQPSPNGGRVDSYVIAIRDPDWSNEFLTFGHYVEIIDVDFGRADLRDPDEFAEWRDSLLAEAERLSPLGDAHETPAAQAARKLREIVAQAELDFGHRE